MFKLIKFEATNVIGFKHGLGRKKVSLDLSMLGDKKLIVIMGDNASGKSTFLSLIHPTHTPSDKRNKFIIKGKEGVISHEYLGTDGTVIKTKVIYTPKKDTHTVKAFFTIIRDGNETEMNPNGNISSYNVLLESFFGLTSEFVKFASYRDTAKGIVHMTDQERKMNVSPLIPNTKRLTDAFNILNGRYKDLNSQLKVLSQKIIRYGDESELEDKYERLTEEFRSLSEERDSLIETISVCKGRIKELTKDMSAEKLQSLYHGLKEQHNDMKKNILSERRKLDSLQSSMARESASTQTYLQFTLEKIQAEIDAITIKASALDDRISLLQSNLTSLENQISVLDSTAYSISNQNPDELEHLKQSLSNKLKQIEYRPDKYSGVSYERCIELAGKIDQCGSGLLQLMQTYGEYVNLHGYKIFKKKGEYVEKIRKKLTERQNVLIYNENELEIQVQELQQKIAKMTARLEMSDSRSIPAQCNVPTCPFAESVRMYDALRISLDKTEIDFGEKTASLKAVKSELRDSYEELNAVNEIYSAFTLMCDALFDIDKYIGVTIEDIVLELVNHSTLHRCFKMKEIRNITAILSEKDLYHRIVEVDIPNIDKNIQMAQEWEKNVKSIEENRQRLIAAKQSIEKSISSDKKNQGEYRLKLTELSRAAQIKSKATSLQASIDSLSAELEIISAEEKKSLNTLSAIDKLLGKAEHADTQLSKISTRLSSVARERETTYYDLLQLSQLKTEKAGIDLDFTVASVMRNIIYPGKNLWKKMIDIYMEDIRNIANHILMFTFDGNLSLSQFEITDTRFSIPYVFNGEVGDDISYASSSQQTMISNAISMAVISKLLDKYGIITMDEIDKDLSPHNKQIFVKILTSQLDFGINQCFLITHNPSYYLKSDVGFILFPGASSDELDEGDYIEVLQ